MNLNNDLVDYDDNVLKSNLMFFTRINNIVRWFERFNKFIVSTHIKNDSDLEKIEIIDKPPVEISLTVLSKLDIGKFFTTDEYGETIFSVLTRHQEYLQLQLNYINTRPSLKKKLDKEWYRSEVLNEFNYYLLLLLRLGNISKSALVNIRKREEIERHVNENPAYPKLLHVKVPYAYVAKCSFESPKLVPRGLHGTSTRPNMDGLSLEAAPARILKHASASLT